MTHRPRADGVSSPIGWSIHPAIFGQTSNLLRALDLLSTRGDWQDRGYGLTSCGRAVALHAFHLRASGPRSSLWG